MRTAARYQSLDDRQAEPAIEQAVPEAAELRREQLKVIHSQPESQRDPEPTPEPVSELDAWEAKKDAYARELDELIRSGKLEQKDRAYRERVFDNQELVRMKAQELQEARNIAAEVRAREGAEHAREHGRDQRER